ncbi:[NiFe]-hydrogenase assembly chaperone HybE [Magnetovibrio sp.]|uniref:[NiFe]-hydrogenase assembly chaperone HybE n=1 Tax=Magnetovibrio sp. TaxID=2024836 RepID=UPI002F94D0F3
MTSTAPILAEDNETAPGRMECGVCWYVYDPAVGDDVWQIEPGVAFHDLPAHWQCPTCDAKMSSFMPLSGERQHADAEDDIARIVAIYRRIDLERMQDLPFRNDALQVEAVGFCDWHGDRLGVIISPWFINLVLVPGADTDWSVYRHGDKVQYVFPAGRYDFVHGDLEDFGFIQSCSLMSPVGDVQDQDTARLIGEEVMRLMMIEADPSDDDRGTPLLSAVAEPEATTPKTQQPISRRELLRGRRIPSSEET